MAEKMTFEQALDKLNQIAEELESGMLGLDDSLERYAEASKLMAFCHKKLNVTQSKIVKLMTEAQAGSEEG